ncbi:MAG: isochorismate synthase [Candidatus Zixiibacteriota bacterium]
MFSLKKIWRRSKAAVAEKQLSTSEVAHEQVTHKLRGEVKRILQSAAIGGEAGVSLIKSLAVPVEDCSPLEWLRSQKTDLKVYWSDRSGLFQSAGIDAADIIDQTSFAHRDDALRKIKDNLSVSNEGVRYYGGMRFDNTAPVDNDWKPFGKYFFFVPRFEMYRTSGQTWLVCNLFLQKDKSDPESVLREFNNLSFIRPSNVPDLPPVTSRTDLPDEARWNDIVQAALNSLDRHQYQKIVLARKAMLEFEGDLEPLQLMQKLQQEISNSYHFYFQLNPYTAFLGATPERLYHRSGKRIKCDAVAGTRPRGANDSEDRKLGEELLNSAKDRREHRFVIDSITDALGDMCDQSVHAPTDSPTLLKLPRLQHLHTRLEGTLSGEPDDSRIIDVLHPTAAVGGYPREGMLDEIQRLERFDRGWYAAPIGWINKNTAEFAVAIRSALSLKNHLCLYAGAGILDGSIASNEWRETEDKMSNFLRLVGQ